MNAKTEGINLMMNKIIIARNKSELNAGISQFRKNNETISLVPTMGALHDGHLKLVKLAKLKSDRTIVSIYVNPTQFAPGEDFELYPRTESNDINLLTHENVDIIYIPNPRSMYDEDHTTKIVVGGVAEGLETNHRPTFFEGVALIVTKLLNRIQPDYAIFGEKDYQQLATIRRLVDDLDIPVKVIGAEIARDNHGLALSSRNKYLNQNGLEIARKLNKIMISCANSMSKGTNVDEATQTAKAQLLKSGFSSVDYIEVRSPNSLTILEGGVLSSPARLLVAAHCQDVRLIDNYPIS